MKKFTALSLALVMVLGVFTACSKPATPPSTPKSTATSTVASDKAKEPITITAMVMQSRNYDGLQKMIQKLKDEENITIDLQVVPDDQYTNLMKIKVTSGECPDMIDYNIPTVFYEMNPSEYFVDLSSEAWVSDLVTPDNILFDGKVYGYPFQSVQGVEGFVYNKDVFKTLGLKEPTTWDELLALCETIKTKGDGISPIQLPKDTWVPQIYLSANFATALGSAKSKEVAKKLESNELKWTEVPEFEKVLDNYLSLFTKGYINSDFASVNYDASIEAVSTGKAAMIYCGDFFASSAVEAFPDANLGMFSVSLAGSSEYIAATTESVGFMCYKESKNIDTVKKIFQLWSTPEYGNLYFATRPGFPALKSIDGGATPSYLTGINEKFIQPGKTIPEFNASITITKNLFQNTMWIYLLDAPAKGNMTGKDMLTKFQGDFESYMKEMKQPGF